MPQAEAVINASVADGATTWIWFANDQATYPQLIKIEGKIPVDFIHFIGSGALTLRINGDAQRQFNLYSAGSIEIGDAKAHGVSISNSSGGALSYTLRLVSK